MATGDVAANRRRLVRMSGSIRYKSRSAQFRGSDTIDISAYLLRKQDVCWVNFTNEMGLAPRQASDFSLAVLIYA